MAYHMPFNLSSLNGTFDFATWLKHSNISFSDLSVLPEISTREKVLKISTYVLAMMLSLGFNSLIIVVIAKTKSLRTKFNFYVINLACVNILIVLTCMWLHLVTNLNPSKWPLGSFFCKIHTFMQVLVVSVSVFTLTVTIMDRFFAAVYPRFLPITQSHQVTVIILTWISGSLLALPWLLYTRFVEYDWLGGHAVLCQAHFPSEESRKSYVTASVVIGYAVPIIVMFVLIIVTMIKSAPPKQPTTEQRNVTDHMKRKALTMLLTVLIVFFLCWSPPQFERLWDVYRYKGPGAKLPKGIHALAYASYYIAYFSSCIYPLVYIGFNKCFRHAAWACLTRKPDVYLAVIPEAAGRSRSISESGIGALELQSVAVEDNITSVSL